MAQNELRRRRVQLDKLAGMRERAAEDGDAVRQKRIEDSIVETEQRIVELEAKQSQERSGA